MHDRRLPVLYGPSFNTEKVWLFPLPARSSDLSPTENIWSMVAERLSRHHTAVTSVDDLWHRVEAALVSVPVDAIQSLFGSMPRKAVKATALLFPLLGLTHLMFCINPKDDATFEEAYMITNAILQSSQVTLVTE
ncbi:uncharacterized protein TNCV_4480571 [Trichonephila clavipes]|nr:uncharacterized protein TNCV_4480571 [Trichonephila clavipes]